MTREELAEEITKDLIDQGKLVESGWIGLRILTISPQAPQDQLDEMRSAFFAGAQHMFGSIMTMLDPDEEPTDNDLKRLVLINEELGNFLAEFKAKHNLT